MTQTNVVAAGARRSRAMTWDDLVITAKDAVNRTGLQFLEALAAGMLPSPPLMRTLDVRLTSVAVGEVVFTMEPSEIHYNPIGSVHGGVYSTLLDSAAACAVHSMLPAGVGYTSLDLSVRFVSPIRLDTGVVTCTGTVTHLGRRTAVAQAVLETSTGKLLATATSSCLILPG